MNPLEELENAARNKKTERERKITFLDEWRPEHFELMKKAIVAHFKHRVIESEKGGKVQLNSFTAINTYFGLAYTSASSFAMYSICNDIIYFDAEKKWWYERFAIGTDGYYYAEIQDKDENVIIIKLYPLQPRRDSSNTARLFLIK